MVTKTYKQLEEEYQELLDMIKEQDDKIPMHPNFSDDWEDLPFETKNDINLKNYFAMEAWRSDLESIQFGALQAKNTLLQYRFDVIMKNKEVK